MKKAWKVIYPVLITAVVVIAGVIVLEKVLPSFSLGNLFDIFGKGRTITDHGPIILDAIRTQAKLETVEMVFANDVEKGEEWGIGNVCKEKIHYLGYVNVTAGIDLHEITPSSITVINNQDPSKVEVTIKLPKAQYSSRLDTQNSKTLTQTDALLLPFACGGSRLPAITQAAQQSIIEAAEKAALAKGILPMAEERAGFELQQLLYNVGYPKVTIQYAAEGENTPVPED